MRILDVQRDRRFYEKEEMPPESYKEEPLAIWRFSILRGLLQKHLKENNPLRDQHVLNIAGGWGREAYLILKEGARHLTLCDFSHAQTLYAMGYLRNFHNKSFICGDGEKLPLKDKSVDLSLIAEGLHHFPNPLIGVREMIRVTKKAIVFDEPGGGIFRSVVNNILISCKIKERLERGYLQEYRISKATFMEFSGLYTNIVYKPYFIYYFKWYKNTKSLFFKKMYQISLKIFNIFFHLLGNRVIIILNLKDERST